jgi:hypothetical protein
VVTILTAGVVIVLTTRRQNMDRTTTRNIPRNNGAKTTKDALHKSNDA